MFNKKSILSAFAALIMAADCLLAGCIEETVPDEPVPGTGAQTESDSEIESLTRPSAEAETDAPETETESETESETLDIYDGFLDYNTEAPDEYRLVFETIFGGEIVDECIVDEDAVGMVFSSTEDVTNFSVIALDFNGEDTLQEEP